VEVKLTVRTLILKQGTFSRVLSPDQITGRTNGEPRLLVYTIEGRERAGSIFVGGSEVCGNRAIANIYSIAVDLHDSMSCTQPCLGSLFVHNQNAFICFLNFPANVADFRFSHRN